MAFDVIIQVNGSPDDELIASSSMVEVCERIGEPTTYRIEVPLAEKDGDFALLLDRRIGVGSDITVATAIDDVADVLCVGQVYGQKIRFQHNVGESRVQVLGGDRMFEMDRTVVKKVHTGVKVSDAISNILTPYVDSVSVDSIATKFEDKTHELVQCDTDLRFVRRLARRYGHWFRVAADKDAKVTAYFKRPVLEGTPTATLSINSRETANLDEIEIEWDVERPAVAQGDQVNLRNTTALDGALARSPLSPLGTLGFGDIATNKKEVRVVAPLDDAGDFTARSEAALIEGGWFVRARGSIATRGLKAVLHTHNLVELNGAGTRYSGKYVVGAVRHVFGASSYIQHFELIRNAWEA